MPRAEYEGAVYHVTVRMAGRAWETGRGLTPAACLFRDAAERLTIIFRTVPDPRGMRSHARVVRSGLPGPKCLSMTIGSVSDGSVIFTPARAAASLTKNSSLVSCP